jgi:hypothetical protein
MNAGLIHFVCPKCRARIKANGRLKGRTRPCPGCRQPCTAPAFVAEDAGPVLVPLEEPREVASGFTKPEHALHHP